MTSRVVGNIDTPVDIALKQYSSVQGLLKLWEDNADIALFNADLTPGQEVAVEEGLRIEPPVAAQRTEVIKDTRYRRAVLKGQNLPDIAIQEYGSIEGLFSLTRENGISVTEVLLPGDELKLDAKQVTNKRVNRYFTERNIKVVTGQEYEADITGPYWIDELGNYIVDENGAFIRHEI